MLMPEKILKQYMELFPDADHHAKTFRDGLKNGEFLWPGWCYLPVAASYAIVEKEAAEHGQAMDSDIVPHVGNLAAVLAWKALKGIYRFDSDLIKSLWSVELDKKLPTEIFFDLPEWCCYIDLENFSIPVDANDDRKNYVGFFVFLEHDANTAEKEIRLVFVTKNGDVTNVPFHIDAGKTIADMFKGMLDYAKKYMAPENVSLIAKIVDYNEVTRFYAPFFSIILYLCTADRDIVQISKSRKPRNKASSKKQKRQLPVHYRVGTSIGSAIRRAKNKKSVTTGTGIKKSPHLRKAHYHLYWTGPGRKIPKLKFVHTILVNIGDEPVTPIVRRVK